MTDLTTAPMTIEEIRLWHRLWRESAPVDPAAWDDETVGDCDRFLTILIERLEAQTARADATMATD